MTKRKVFYTILSIVLTVFFIRVLFPFYLIKEVAIIKIESILNDLNIDSNVEIDSLSTYWLSGIEAKQIKIDNKTFTDNSLNIEDFNLRISILPLIMGKLNITSNILINQGEAHLFLSLSLLDLILGKTSINEANAQFTHFKLDNLFSQVIYFFKTSNNPDFSLIAPIIENSSLGGFLEGDLKYKSSKNFTSYINFKVKNAYLDINNETLNIPKQNFSFADIYITHSNSLITIQKETLFKAQNVSLNLDGNIKLAQQKNQKQNINLKLNLILSGQIEKSFGFLIPQLLKCPSSSIIQGIMNVNLTGTNNEIVCNS